MVKRPPSRKTFRESALADEKVQQLFVMLRKGMYAINFPENYNSIQTMHSTRMTRHIKRKELMGDFQDNYVDSVLQTQAFRSRVVEIKMETFKVRGLLKSHIEALSARLSTNASIKEYTTVSARKMATNEILSPAIKTLDKMTNLIDYADLVIADLDKSAWALKNILDAMQLNQARTHEI